MLLVWNCLENEIPIQWCAELLNCFVHIFMYRSLPPLPASSFLRLTYMRLALIQVLLLPPCELEIRYLVEEVHHALADRTVRPRQLTSFLLVRLTRFYALRPLVLTSHFPNAEPSGTTRGRATAPPSMTRGATRSVWASSTPTSCSSSNSSTTATGRRSRTRI